MSIKWTKLLLSTMVFWRVPGKIAKLTHECFPLFLVSLHWGKRMKKTNYIPFERGENFLSIGNKISFPKRLCWRVMQEVGKSIFCVILLNFTKSAECFRRYTSFLPCCFIYRHGRNNKLYIIWKSRKSSIFS